MCGCLLTFAFLSSIVMISKLNEVKAMYLWIGIDVDEQLLSIKEKIAQAETDIGFKNSNLTLPLHISLKMSFEVDHSNYDAIYKTVTNYYQTLRPFKIEVDGIKNEGNIVWILMKPCDALNKIHDDLNTVLKEKYGIPLHEYDTDYKFHTTLFMDSDTDKINAAYDTVKNENVSSVLAAERFVIGRSETGALGTYKVIKTVSVG